MHIAKEKGIKNISKLKKSELIEELVKITPNKIEKNGVILTEKIAPKNRNIEASIHIEENVNVPMFNTNIELASAGAFHGNMVVSMRPIPNDLVVKAVEVTAAMPMVHGAPIQIGNPQAIGILDVNHPDYGDSVTINEGEVPVFWPCGVTPQNAVMQTKPPIAITHAPGHMFITDVKNVALKY